MERFSFGTETALTPSENLLEAITIAPLTPSITSGAKVQIAIFRIAPNGRIRRHPATVPQIIAILKGHGEVSGSDGTFEPVGKGDAVYFAEGEEHETRTAEGLVALMIEGPDLVPFRGSRHSLK